MSALQQREMLKASLATQHVDKAASASEKSQIKARATQERIGEVVSVNGAYAVIMVDADSQGLNRSFRPQIGAMMNIKTGTAMTVGRISAMSAPAPSGGSDDKDAHFIELELIGEFSASRQEGETVNFHRGISCYPILGDSAHMTSHKQLTAIFTTAGQGHMRVGSVVQDAAIPAVVSVDDLFSRHCAFVGATGAGKSYATALMMRLIVERYDKAHIVLFDQYNEYKYCFGQKAVWFEPSDLNLPFWMMTFDELAEVVFPGREGYEQELEILSDLIPRAKKLNMTGASRIAGANPSLRSNEQGAFSLNTPSPYRISDLLQLIDKTLGGMEAPHAKGPYKRLRSRLYSISQDARYAFMFGALSVQDNMAATLGALFRIPVEGSPISIIALGGLPDEVCRVIVSMTARLAYDFGLWSNAAAPIALVCEDAHRYAPANAGGTLSQSHRSLIKIAKEGRKCGVSLWALTQRPTELDPTVLSQCSTIFAMRLANQADQEALQAAAPGASTSLLGCLPSLSNGEAIAIGEAIALSARISFDALPEECTPRDVDAHFTDAWMKDGFDNALVEHVVAQWRAQRFAD